MTTLRITLIGCLLLAVTSVGWARQEKGAIDKDKLVGTWKFVKTDSKNPPPPGASMNVTFTKDGKVTVHLEYKGKERKVPGTYSVKGNQLTMARKMADGKEFKETMTIAELTAKKLVTKEKEEDRTVTTEFAK